MKLVGPIDPKSSAHLNVLITVQKYLFELMLKPITKLPKQSKMKNEKNYPQIKLFSFSSLCLLILSKVINDEVRNVLWF